MIYEGKGEQVGPVPLWKQVLIVVILAALAYGGYEAYAVRQGEPGAEAAGSGATAPVAVELATAEERILRRTVEAVGTTRARRSVEISPLASGRVVGLDIVPGQAVEAGTILARLDDDIERANLAEAEARLVEMRLVVERLRTLRSRNAASDAAVEEAEARQAEAIAAHERAVRRLADRSVRAPFAGIAGLTNYDIGARVDEDTVLTRIDDLAEVEVEFSLPETLFAQISAGQRVSARTGAFPDRDFVGRVFAIDSRIEPTSRAFRVRAVVPNPEHLLPAGMFMSLEIVLAEETFLVVPEEAIVVQSADVYVFVDSEGRAERRRVQTGMRRDGYIAVLSGLASGERVVIRGIQRVRDGLPLRVLGDEASLRTERSRARIGSGG